MRGGWYFGGEVPWGVAGSDMLREAKGAWIRIRAIAAIEIAGGTILSWITVAIAADSAAATVTRAATTGFTAITHAIATGIAGQSGDAEFDALNRIVAGASAYAGDESGRDEGSGSWNLRSAIGGLWNIGVAIGPCLCKPLLIT
jgi:hypothetical protein